MSRLLASGGPGAGRPPRTLVRFCLALCLFWPAPLLGQDPAASTGDAQSDDTYRTRFASFDVGFGIVLPEEGQLGVSYGLGVDVANLLLRGTSVRFGFRFWTTEDRLPDGRLVDLDDAILSLMLKKSLDLGRMEAYGGIGAGGHFIAARFRESAVQTEERNGFRLGLEGLLGLEYPLVDRGFVSLFAEGQGSLVSELAQLSLHAGLRIRFDRLGTGG